MIFLHVLFCISKTLQLRVINQLQYFSWAIQKFISAWQSANPMAENYMLLADPQLCRSKIPALIEESTF